MLPTIDRVLVTVPDIVEPEELIADPEAIIVAVVEEITAEEEFLPIIIEEQETIDIRKIHQIIHTQDPDLLL